VAHYAITVDEMPRWIAEASEEQFWGLRLRLWRDGEPVRVFLVTVSWLSMVSGEAWRRVGDEKTWRAVADLAADRIQHVALVMGSPDIESRSRRSASPGTTRVSMPRRQIGSRQSQRGCSFASSTLERRPVGGSGRSVHDAARDGRAA